MFKPVLDLDFCQYRSYNGNGAVTASDTAQDTAGYPASEIAAYFGIGSSGVTQLVRKFKGIIAKDLKLLEISENLRQQLSSV